jgi:cell division septation protein DedD
MNNQRGGFLSKIFIIPAGVALMVVFFFLGYYVGKYQSGQVSQAEKPGTLPEIASQYLPKKEELTFYKTLTERDDKTVSVDLKPKQKETEAKAGPVEPGAGAGPRADIPQRKPEKQLEVTIDRTAPAQPKQPGVKAGQTQAKKETVSAAEPSEKVRFTVQIASYPDKDMAEEEMKRMKKRGYAAFIVASELEDKGTWYRVRLGSFSNKTAAEKLATELRSKENLNPFVTVE